MNPTDRLHPYAIFTHSVGAHAAGHCLLSKLSTIAAAMFDGIELFQDDLDAFVRSPLFQSILDTQHHPTPPATPINFARRSSFAPPTFKAPSHHDDLLVRNEFDNIIIRDDDLPMTYNAHGICTATAFREELAAASYIGSYCKRMGLKMYSLQPLRDFEGWVDPVDRHLAIQRVRSRFPVMNALGTDMLLICSNNISSPKTTGDIARIGQDLANIADLAACFDPSIRIGFEALSWGAHVDLWSDAWAAVQLVNRANVGLILDSFNTLGRQYADPCSPTGIIEGSDTYRLLLDSLKQLFKIPAEKIFFLQIGDAKKMDSPLPVSSNADEPRPARMIWSRGNRLFPCEKDRFLPVHEFMHAAVIQTGYKGPWSIEVFNDSLFNRCGSVPTTHARRARDGLDKLVAEVYD